MNLSEDEQDDDNIFDQLKSIKPFTVDQLYLLHPDVGCPSTNLASYCDSDSTTGHANHDQTLYQNLVDYEQLKHKLNNLVSEVKHLNRKMFNYVENVWVFTDKEPRKIGMCLQGKIAETTLKYRQAFLDEKQLNTLSISFDELSEMIGKDYIYYSFESQMKLHKIETQLSISYQTSDEAERAIKLKSAISTLIDFMKHLGDSRSDFLLQCRKWLRSLIRKFLDQDTTENYQFIISQLSKGPAGTADWSADLIACKHFDQIEFDSTPQYITHCSALLSELFNNLRVQLKKLVASNSDNLDPSAGNDFSDQNWSLIDPRFSCSEELRLVSGNSLTESDVTKFCLKIPVAQIFRSYVQKCLEFNEFRQETDKNYEYIMLKLLTIGTIVIKTYQIGLETFNSIQYGNLIEYLSSQIRTIVIVLSDQWTEFKRRLKGVDDALMMRLQVEYDNFILRSILIILELRHSGIWRHLSRMEQGDSDLNEGQNSWSTDSIRPAFAKLLQVTGIKSNLALPDQANTDEASQSKVAPSSPHRVSSSLTYQFSTEWFKEVSEPMLWHILWQFYHNAFVSSCDYHSDNYWLEKFKEKSVVYLFVNKIRDSSPGECSYLLNSITSMLLSRTRKDSKLVNFVALEICNLAFKHDQTIKDKITNKGVQALIRSAEKFPHLISLFISYMSNEGLSDDIVDLIKECSLSGWLCNEEELDILASWLIEHPLSSARNKVARLLISKLLLNSPEFRTVTSSQEEGDNQVQLQNKNKKSFAHCFVDLKTRRRLALLLYEASVRHLPENNDFGPQSLGTFVEVAFGDLFCELNPTSHNNLLELAIDINYQKLYVWIWRLLFTFRMHILNQPETDWNDVQSRSGTSRSIKNTVLLNDLFHPVPSIQDSECLSISEGLKKYLPIASFIYLLMTDVTWQADTLDVCLTHLNMMANSGHLTPSLMAMKFLTICHINKLTDTVAKDKRCLEYFNTIITGNFDANRLASLIVSQLQRLKQYRQLQLSQFYINILLEVAAILIKQNSSSWFSGNEYSLEKVACLLDYLVKFNFTTQRPEIIRKFYDSSYSIQDCKATGSWFGSNLFTSNSQNSLATRRDFLTILHILTQKFKKFFWLRWITTECDTLRLEKIWENIVAHLNANESASLDSAIKKICPQINASILKTTLPIYSWLKLIFDIVEADVNHPLCPLIWYNFFLNYFANWLNGVSVGLKLVPQETLSKLQTRLDSLFNYHLYKHRNWSSTGTKQQNSLAKLYRAYRRWLQDTSLQDAYLDIDRLGEEYLVHLLKAVMESTEGACFQYIDVQSIETQNKNLTQVWSTATKLTGNKSIKEMMFVDSKIDNSCIEIVTSVDDEASDAVSLILKTNQTPSACNNSDDELKVFSIEKIDVDKLDSVDDMMDQIKRSFDIVFKESSIFGSNISELDRTKGQIVDLIQQLYVNVKREHVQVVPCADGIACVGPAKIKFEVEEAKIDDRKSECIQDRQRQCEELVGDLLQMPTRRTVHSTILIEDYVKHLIKRNDLAKQLIESLLRWISEPKTYHLLNGSYHAANHLLRQVLEILSNTAEVDTYNSALIDVCFEHPGSVQIFSPHLSPSACSTSCFLELYKKISSRHAILGPMSMFVLLSKFDVNNWLKSTHNDKQLHHEIIKTTCSGLKSMGKQPDESFILTFDLYRRHIQVELASPDRRLPIEITLVFEQFLISMDEQLLAPSLWSDFMTVIGLEKHLSPHDGRSLSTQTDSNSSSISDTIINSIIPRIDESLAKQEIEEITRLAECQKVLDYHSLNNLIQVTCRFINDKFHTTDINLLELYQDYLKEFSIVLTSVTFMWLKSVGENYPDNHELTWKQFMELWFNLVFFSKNCLREVDKNSYIRIANHFVASIRFMICRIPDNSQQILQSVLSTLADYVKCTKEVVVYLELSILQGCLKELPWSSFIMLPADFDDLASLSEQENYNVSDFVSHVLQKAMIKESLTKIYESDNASILPHVVERLATTIVLQSAHLKGFRLNGGFFTLIPVSRIPKIASLILPRMEFANLEQSQTNKLLVNLLRYMCIRLDVGQEPTLTESSHHHITDSFDRSVIYAQFVSSYLVNLIKDHPPVVKYKENYLDAVMDNSLQDLKILSSPDVDITKKTAIYVNLLECCSNTAIDGKSRLMLAKCLIKSALLRDRPIVVMEVFHSIGQIMSDGKVLVHTIEKMINLYLNMNGHYEKVWKSFCLKALSSEAYLGACIEESAPLALLIFFESATRNSENNNNPQQVLQTWTCFFNWISQLSVVTYVTYNSVELKSNDIKLAIAWLRLLDMLESNLLDIIHEDIIGGSGGGAGAITDDTITLSVEPAIPANEDGSNSGSSSSSSDKGSIKQTNSRATSVSGDPISESHKALIGFIRQLISRYDSFNSGGLWSYIWSTRSEEASRISLIALAVACFLADRALICLTNSKRVNETSDLLPSSSPAAAAAASRQQQPAASPSAASVSSQDHQTSLVSAHLTAFRNEISKLVKTSLSKLEGARKSKYYLESAQFIEALIESVKRNDKVQYTEGVQLIATFVKSAYSSEPNSDEFTYISKILPTLN